MTANPRPQQQNEGPEATRQRSNAHLDLTILVLRLVIGFAVALLIFVFFLQTRKSSLSRPTIAFGLAIIVAATNCLACIRWLAAAIGQIWLHGNQLAAGPVLLRVAAETRRFLVPQALNFIPGVLFLMDRLLGHSQPACARAVA